MIDTTMIEKLIQRVIKFSILVGLEKAKSSDNYVMGYIVMAERVT